MTDIIERQSAVMQDLRGAAQQIIDIVDAAVAIDPEQPEGPENQNLFPLGLPMTAQSLYICAKRYMRKVEDAEQTEGEANGEEN